MRRFPDACGFLQSAERVILIFSVNESKHFQGYARMLDKIDTKSNMKWMKQDGRASWGNVLSVWLLLHFPFFVFIFPKDPSNLQLHQHSA